MPLVVALRMRTADRWHDAGMRPRTVRLLTGLATLAVLASAAYVAALGDWATASACAACTFAVAVGWVIVRHDPTSPVGPALAWTTAPIALVTAHVGPLAELPWSSGAWPLNLAGLLVLMLVFPDGASNGTPWRTVPWVFGSATLGMLAVQWGARQVDGEVVGGPDAVWVPWVAVASLIAIGFSMVLAAASLVVRYWRGTRRTRQQTRWLLLAGIVVVALLAGGWVAEALGASLNAAYTPFLVAIVVLVPIAVGLAIVRYDLFDVDRLLTGATAWLVTVVVSAAVFGAAVYGLSQAVSAGTGLTSSVAAFITALTLLPVQRHVAQCVGRVVDRDRHVAVAEVERFAADVRAGRRQPEEVEAVLRKVQDDPDLVVYLARPDGNWTRLDGAPVAEPPDGIGIEAGGDVIARVSLGWDSARARRRLDDVAKAAWVPLEVTRLRLVLREALTETEASRHRLVDASAAERRRLERDLHDGAQQRIVATGMRLRLLQEHLPTDQAAEVDAAVAELQGTVDELRRIAQGVRPVLLDDGLAAALAAVKSSSPIPFVLTVGDLPLVSEARAFTAYLVVTEAVANVLKHAGASRISVTVAARQDWLAVEVVDNGVGGVAANAPLAALRDRIVSVGGTLGIRATPGGGTTIQALI